MILATRTRAHLNCNHKNNKHIIMSDSFIITNLVTMCLDAYKNEGISITRLFQHAGQDIRLLDNPIMDIATANALYAAAYDITGNDTLGINAGRNVSPTTFHALGYAAIASKNLLESFRLIASFSYGINSLTRLAVFEEEHRIGFGFELPPPGKEMHFLGYDAATCMTARICRQLQAGPAAIREVDMGRAKPADVQAFEHYFKAPIHWNRDRFVVYFEPEYFLRPNKHANPFLVEESLKGAKSFFDGLISAMRYTQEVKRAISQRLDQTDLSLAHIAAQMNLSERTLQRYLSDEGTSFRQLADDIKREAAKYFVQTTDLNVSEIAYSLGFNDSGNFTRAFKRWFGCAPLVYRQRHADQAACQ